MPDPSDLDALLAAMPAPLDEAGLALARAVWWKPARRRRCPAPATRSRAGACWPLWAHDLPLVKLYEAHADARAILAELGVRLGVSALERDSPLMAV